jgi:hypothetical protein
MPTTVASENVKQKGRTIAQSSSIAAGVRTATNNTAKHNNAMQLRDEVTISSYSR